MFHVMALQHARQNPQSLAFDSLAQDWSFARLEQDVLAVSRALERLREAEPRMVGIHCSNLYWHWVLILSLASLGLASASLPESASPSFLRDVQLLQPELVISFGGLSLQDVQVLVIDEAWLGRIGKISGPPVEVSLSCDAICRYAIASGTDAERGVLSMTYRQAETAIMHLMLQDRIVGTGPVEPSHVLSTIGLISLTGFIIGCSALCSGSPLNFVSHTDIGILIARKVPTVAVVTPEHLAHIVEVLPPGMTPLETLTLVVTGGRLNDALRDKAHARLTSALSIVYGADECGALALGRAGSMPTDDMVGSVLPWVTLQLVDATGTQVAQGEEGIVRVSGTGVLSGYVGASEKRSRHFSGAWFYPGDRGILDRSNILRITGRVDDLVSLGGDKFDLGVIDDIARSILATRELGSFLAVDESGRTRLNMALASGRDFDGEQLAQALRAFYPSLPPVCVMKTDYIPWSLDGRVDRERLAGAFSRAAVVMR